MEEYTCAVCGERLETLECCIRCRFDIRKDYGKYPFLFNKNTKAINNAYENRGKALYNLGKIYCVIKEYDKAMESFKKAAILNDSGAQNEIAKLYKNGMGIAKNEKKAAEYYKKAAEAGNAEAQYNWGECLYWGRGVFRNMTDAKKWYELSAKKGNINAQYMMGRINYVVRDYEKALKWYKISAEHGNVEAQFKVYECYENGIGVDLNKSIAKKWLHLAAENGHTAAQEMLEKEKALTGNSYNENISLRSVQSKTEQPKVGVAQYELGMRYLKGDEIEQNDIKALELLKQSAEQGNPDAQYVVGYCYQKGRGTRKDVGVAKEWYRKAMKKGHAQASRAMTALLCNLKIDFKM